MAFVWKSELIAGVEIYHNHASITQITEIRTNFDSLNLGCACQCISNFENENSTHLNSHLNNDNTGHDSVDDEGYNTSDNSVLDTNNLNNANSSQLANYYVQHVIGGNTSYYDSYYPGDDISHDGADKSSDRATYHSLYDISYEVGYNYCTSETSQQSIGVPLPPCLID